MLEKCGCAETTASRGQSALLIIGTGIALLFTKLERSQRKKMIIMSRNIWCSAVWLVSFVSAISNLKGKGAKKDHRKFFRFFGTLL